ncbi:MAG: PPOX class F420-dependent oxidoreductase [Actinomycetota bacterium]|nr:PPOX class F420-dependent oxidoreductase [Actinomycetota bacterium]
MSVFTEREIEYLRDQSLGRLATVGRDGEPHVVPLSFRYNEDLETIDIGGHNLGRSKKFRDIGSTGKAALVVDDVLPPWRPRGVEIRGRAEALGAGGRAVDEDFDEELIRIHPERIVGWGLDSDAYAPNSRSVS